MKEPRRCHVFAGMTSFARRIVFAASTAIALLVPQVSALAADRPNIVFIMADDLGWADVDFHGGRVPTPHLDALRQGGVEMTHHYVAPVCSPTRSALLSGRFWSRFNVTTPQAGRAFRWDQATLPGMLKTQGYATCLTGKWHLGSKIEWGPNKFGFDHSYGSLGGGVGPWNHFYKKGEYSPTWHRNEELITEEGHATDLITNEAIQWLGGRKDQPFFLYVPFTAVHVPIREPEEWLNKVPGSIADDVPRHYAACIMHLDDSVGRIVAALDKNGQRERTVIVFTSDNGGTDAENNDSKYPSDNYPSGKVVGNNTPLRGKKADVYEGGIRVACLVNWPNKLKPGVCDTPMHIADWTPTFCSLAGYESKTDLKWDGKNLWPVISGTGKAPGRLLYWTAPNYRARAVREGDLKLVETSKGKNAEATFELFDLAKDPNETRDLATEMPDKLAAMKTRLTEVAARDKDAVADEDGPVSKSE